MAGATQEQLRVPTNAVETTEAPEVISVDIISAGDCINVPDDEELFDVLTIDCTQEHDAEVFAICGPDFGVS